MQQGRHPQQYTVRRRICFSQPLPTYFVDESASLPSTSTGFHSEFDPNYEGIFTKFEAFLSRASTCQNIFTNLDTQPSQFTNTTKSTPRRHIILLEDLPNILHARTQVQFHEALNSLVASAPANPAVPLVIIISDAGMRGEASDERIAGDSERNKMQVVDVRTVLSKNLLGGPFVTEIGYLSFSFISLPFIFKAHYALLDLILSPQRSFAKLSKLSLRRTSPHHPQHLL